MIKLRFASGIGFGSALIRFQAGTAIPFTPTHVECVSQDGKSFIGARIDGGVIARKPGYDAPQKNELFVDLPAKPEVEKAFYDFVQSKIGSTYDWKAILGFADTEDPELHDKGEFICSALMAAGLVHSGAFPKLAVPYHHITPRDVLLTVSSHVKVN